MMYNADYNTFMIFFFFFFIFLNILKIDLQDEHKYSC